MANRGCYALRRLVLMAGMTLPAASAEAADGLDLSGTMRFRYEAIANQARAGFRRNDDLVNLRTTLLARYTDGPLTLATELWDSRVYGQKADTILSTGEVNTFEFVQAYARYAQPLDGGGSLAVKAGRFLLNIGSRRLIAADDYRNTTNGYTGLEAVVDTPGLSATLIYVLPQQRRPDDAASIRARKVVVDEEGFDQQVWGGTVLRNKAFGDFALEASFYHLGERDTRQRSTRDRSLDTFGGRLMRAPHAGQADLEIEAFRQIGHISATTAPTAARLPVSAYFAHIDTGYTFKGAWQTRLSIEYDRASGDGSSRQYGRFDTLFGQRRADFAPGGLYNTIARSNVSTPGIRIEVTPSRRLDALATYHALWLANRRDAFSASGVRDASGRAGNFAGHQLDGRLRYWLKPGRLRFEADAVLLAKGRFLEEAPNAPPAGTTLYGSVNLTADF